VRSFAAQLEALDRHRGKGRQVVRVEHVTVNAGGQAIVGAVGQGGGGDGGSGRQPHASGALAHEPGVPLRGADPGGDAVPVAGGAGQAAVPDARRGGRRRARLGARGTGRGGTGAGRARRRRCGGWWASCCGRRASWSGWWCAPTRRVGERPDHRSGRGCSRRASVRLWAGSCYQFVAATTCSAGTFPRDTDRPVADWRALSAVEAPRSRTG
jgi:hypothetical protein